MPDDEPQRMLRAIFERGAESASQALSKWLGADVRLTVSAVDRVELAAAADVLGPPEALVAACAMGLGGPLGGRMILVFQDRSGLALVDLLLNQPVGTTTAWGDVERSAAMETTNIVGCAYLNALAAHLPSGLKADGAAGAELTPSPPVFFHEFAGSLLEFALMDQAVELDEVLLVRSAFSASRADLDLDWTLLVVPDRRSLQALTTSLSS
jgi:chemotaxis protein CheC